MSAVPSPVNVTEALAMVRGGLGYLVAADAAELPAGVQAQCMRGFEQFDAMGTAARAQVMGAFTATQGYVADGDYSAKMWLFHRTRVSRGCRGRACGLGPAGRCASAGGGGDGRGADLGVVGAEHLRLVR